MNRLVHELVAICRAFGTLERQAVCCGTVSVPQCIALQALLDGGPQEVRVLAAALGTTPSATTRLVDGLEERGLVERARAEDDRRRVLVGLTPRGRGEAARLAALTEQLLGAVLARIPASQRAAALPALRAVREAIEAARGADGLCC